MFRIYVKRQCEDVNQYEPYSHSGSGSTKKEERLLVRKELVRFFSNTMAPDNSAKFITTWLEKNINFDNACHRIAYNLPISPAASISDGQGTSEWWIGSPPRR